MVEANSRKMMSSVVAFMVTVKLVENSVKSQVGNVIEVNVMSQYRMPGMTLCKLVSFVTPVIRACNNERGEYSWEGYGDEKYDRSNG